VTSMWLPSVQEAISFVIFFFPGFLSLMTFSLLSGVNINKWSDLRKVVLCSVFSMLSFMFSGVSLTPEQVITSVFTPSSILTVVSISIILGIATGLLSVAWLYISRDLALFAQYISEKTGISYASYEETCLTNILRRILQNSALFLVTVSTSSGSTFRGFLGGYGTNPVEIVLMARDQRPLQKLNGTEWIDLDDCLLVIRNRDILTVSFSEVKM